MSYFVDLIDKVQKLGWIAEYEERGEISMQSSRKNIEHFKRWVSHPSLNAADVSSIQPALFSEGFLR